MSLIERLRAHGKPLGPLQTNHSPIKAMMREAANELEAMQAEVDRLREALTPSAETKAAYIGEFSFQRTRVAFDADGDPDEVTETIAVPWDTTKEIMAAIRTRASIHGQEQ